MTLKSRIKFFTEGSVTQEKSVIEHIQAASSDQEKTSTVQPLELRRLTEIESEIKNKLHEKLLDILDLSLISRMAEIEAREQIRDIVNRLIDEENTPLNTKGKQHIIQEIEDDVLGLGPLEPLLANDSIADILVNGFNSVYVERFGRLELTPVRFSSNAHLMKVIDRIVSKVGRRIDESSPMVDARLEDGSRVNAIIPPLALDGPSLSIRKFIQDKMKLDDLVDRNALTSDMAFFLKSCGQAKLNILISGGTGSGKTTLLNAISNYIPSTERIVTIEDSAELQLQQEHVVRLETRPSNIEGSGEISLRDLVRNSLRMRPDRIVIGEVRSGEAFDMLQAMNTGHEGSLTTVHANKARDSLARLENMVSMAGLDLPAIAVRKQIASAINIIIQLNRLEDGRRIVSSIQEVDGMEGEIITLSEIFKFVRQGMSEEGKVTGEFVSTGIVPRCLDQLKRRGIKIDTSTFINEREK